VDRKLWTEPFAERSLLDGAALPRGRLLSIRGARGALLFVEQGEVWVTQERDLRDIVLPAGTWFRLDRGGTAVVEARRAARVTLTAAADAPLPEIRALPRDASRRLAPGGRRSFMRAVAAWWLRLYRRPRHSVPRRFVPYY
jgi:hypothetical protein